MSFDYDLFVIGGGSGGVRAARIAAGEHGAKVALAEESRMGGTCVIRGCVPKKLMVFASVGGKEIEEAGAYGWTESRPGSFDWQHFHGKLNPELDRLEAAYTRGLDGAGVTIFHQRATVADAHTVVLADGSRHTARHILIAVGGRPTRPDIPGAELGLISDDLFNLETLPRKILLIGGGFIACEFASIFNGLGVDTVLVHRGGAVLRGFDDEMRLHVTEQLIASGVNLRLGVTPERLEKQGDQVLVTFNNEITGVFDKVVFCTGRAPYTKGLGLEEAGVRLGPNGRIEVDKWSQTSVPSIYAVGDVTDQVNLTPVAIRAGHAFADTVFGGKPRSVDLSIIASCVYTRPHELASVGLTEQAAETRGLHDVYIASFRPMRSLFAGSQRQAVMKLIVEAESDRVVGCHIFGPEAGEIIQTIATAIGMGATKADFDNTIAVHPTLAEEIVTMRKPVRQVGSDSDARIRHSSHS